MGKTPIRMSKKHPLGPRITVDVTNELITTAVRASSSHCMIAEAVRIAYPEATRVAADISTIRFSDLSRGLRYVYLTPRAAQDCLVDFDEGINPVPFKFQIKNAHVTRAGSPDRLKKKRERMKGTNDGKKAGFVGHTVPKRRKMVEVTPGSVPRVVGGKRPPQLHTRREFGLRAFRGASLNRLKAEQPVIAESDSQE